MAGARTRGEKTPLAGIPELIEDDCNGLFASPGDVVSLAIALRRLIDDAPLRARLAASGRATVEDGFHLGRSVARLADILTAMPTVARATATEAR